METGAEIFDSAHPANVLRRMSSDPPATVARLRECGRRVGPNVAEVEARMSELFPQQDMIKHSEAGDAE